eukprot:evm.model.scf_301.5 EVM.evm.TU.scf_301.5   scf_301:34014-50656(+)
MACCNPPPKWCGYLAFLGNFTAPKMVLIKDWRLGLLLRCLQILIAAYIVFDLITKGAYLHTSTPKGTITPFDHDTQDPLYFRLSREITPQTHPYCFNETKYEFSWQGSMFKDFECVWATPASIVSKGETETFFTTYFTLDKTFYVKPNRTRCPVPGSSRIPKNAVQVARTDEICVYEMKNYIFPLEPEYARMSFFHTYTAHNGKKKSVQTYIRTPGDPNVGDLTVPVKESIDMNLTTWLRMAGVDLDKPLDQQPYPNAKVSENLKGKDGKYPVARLSGVVIDITLGYYQRKLAPAPYGVPMGSIGKAYEVICIVDIEPHFRWSLKAADVRYMIKNAEGPVFLHPEGNTPGDPGEVVASEVNFKRQGLQFRFHIDGVIGTFSFRSLVTALVTYSVMLSVAQTITTYVALYGLGISSTLYKEFILESVLWRKEYARYAAQALVAGYAFVQYDKDGSFQLSRKEIYAQLKIYFGEELADDKVAALADFLMRHGEEDDDDEDDTKYSTINLFEWIDIFTEGKVCRSSLKRLIDHEYKDEKERKDLMRLAMEPSKTASAIDAMVTTPLLAGGSSGNEAGEGYGASDGYGGDVEGQEPKGYAK